jgi:hypothetical protein
VGTPDRRVAGVSHTSFLFQMALLHFTLRNFMLRCTKGLCADLHFGYAAFLFPLAQ